MQPVYFGDQRLPARFWAKVSPEPNSGCWLWTAAVDPNGYGRFGIPGAYRSTLAHRYAYACLVATPDTLEVCHSCDNPGCVNPGHLFLGTQRDNMQDMSRKGRHRLNNLPLRNSLKTRCDRGHPFDHRNTYHVRGGRRCRRCHAAQQLEYMERKRINGHATC